MNAVASCPSDHAVAVRFVIASTPISTASARPATRPKSCADPDTVDLPTALVREFEKNAWFLRASLEA